MMATVYFYEKPGCANNARQKAMLAAAGHHVVAINLLVEAWTPERLKPYFAGTPVAAWFNRSAPAIKGGAVVPETLSEDRALALMADDPLLIRRPLLRVDGQCSAGFDQAFVDAWIGLHASVAGDMESCRRTRDGKAVGCSS